MESQLINKYLIKEHSLHYFQIIPFVKFTYVVGGNINVDKSIWDKIIEKLDKSKFIERGFKTYIYRDLEMNIISDNETDYTNILQKTQIAVYFDTVINMLTLVTKNTVLDNDSFPKLNQYHNESEKNIKSYKFGSVTLNLITEDLKNNYFEILFQYKEEIMNKILKDLLYVFDILGIGAK